MSAGFELLRFEASPVTEAVAVVELDGRFAERAPARVRLLVEREGRGVEVPAVRSGGERPWTATFAIALDDLADDRTEFALAPGRGPLIALPAPEVAGGAGEERYIHLARQANELRHRLDEATEAAAATDELRADLALARRRAEQAEAAAEAATNEREDAAKAATTERERAEKAARAELESATEAAESARAELDALRDKLRETESQLTETERERAALRARAESADRTVAQLSGQTEELEQRARDAETRLVAAEDETRMARRDLRDTRARLESLLREQRHPEPARRGHEVPGEPGPRREPEPSPPAAGGDAEPTDVLETREIAAADEPASEDGEHDNGTPAREDGEHDNGAPAREDGEHDNGTPPRTTATATRATRVVRIWDEPGALEDDEADEEDAEDEDEDDGDRRARHAHEPLNPGRVGAGHIEPAQTKPPVLTPARIMVAIALLLLVAALLAIVLGAGLI